MAEDILFLTWKPLKINWNQNGITNDTVLIAYDGGEGSFASRFVWLLSYLGHQKVFVLNGDIAPGGMRAIRLTRIK
ncbi:rhodanese-like domain-containing protein [Peribacillus frigoritolerans]|nr:rhodanese-like domain-containing protein [Peribacillus frigoritolerans]